MPEKLNGRSQVNGLDRLSLINYKLKIERQELKKAFKKLIVVALC